MHFISFTWPCVRCSGAAVVVCDCDCTDRQTRETEGLGAGMTSLNDVEMTVSGNTRYSLNVGKEYVSWVREF